ncbi:MAG: hypothetical protein IPL28_22840 [Chloroflexi bacterium]|nr:hypothetical protein [Chloroflexota bacterium]
MRDQRLWLTNEPLAAVGEPFTLHAHLENIAEEPVIGRSLFFTLSRYEQGHWIRLESATHRTGFNGRATLVLNVPTEGQYQVQVWGRDGRGQHLQTTTTFYALQDGQMWLAETEVPLTLYLDQTSYTVGETANLSILSQVSGPALLTWERGTVRHSELITLTMPFTQLIIPVQNLDAPTVYLRVSQWQPAPDDPLENWQSQREVNLATAVTALQVAFSPPLLTIDMVAVAELDGETAVTLRVTDVPAPT